MRFSKSIKDYPKRNPIASSVPVEMAVLGRAFSIRSHRTDTPLRLRCALILSRTVPAWSKGYQGRTPRRCDHPEHGPISIGIEPEGITPHVNVKPGAGSRGIAAVKETCSGTN